MTSLTADIPSNCDEWEVTKLKTIGVLGGLGPQATMDFEARVHRAAQRLIPPSGNRGYPPMVVLYCRHPPVIVTEEDHFTAKFPLEADPRLFDSAAKLGPLCDFIVIPSNGTHTFAPQIERAAGRPVLSMIELTIAEVRRRGWRRVGAIGLGEPKVYIVPLAKLGIECEILRPEKRAAMNRVIAAVMEGGETDEHRGLLRDAIEELRSRRVDGVIVGCTELPLLLSADELAAPDLLNPAELLAEGAVRHAMA
jgi:aspartate racemase